MLFSLKMLVKKNNLWVLSEKSASYFFDPKWTSQHVWFCIVINYEVENCNLHFYFYLRKNIHLCLHLITLLCFQNQLSVMIFGVFPDKKPFQTQFHWAIDCIIRERKKKECDYQFIITFVSTSTFSVSGSYINTTVSLL